MTELEFQTWLTLAAVLIGVALQAATYALLRQAHKVIKTAGAEIRTIELATNSMKDALIESTKSEYYAAGRKDEKDRQA